MLYVTNDLRAVSYETRIVNLRWTPRKGLIMIAFSVEGRCYDQRVLAPLGPNVIAHDYDWKHKLL